MFPNANRPSAPIFVFAKSAHQRAKHGAPCVNNWETEQAPKEAEDRSDGSHDERAHDLTTQAIFKSLVLPFLCLQIIDRLASNDSILRHALWRNIEKAGAIRTSGQKIPARDAGEEEAFHPA